jgi:hypothetical protein
MMWGILGVYCAFGVSVAGIYFGGEQLAQRPFFNDVETQIRALAMIGGVGAVVGLMMGLTSIPRTPLAQVRMETLRESVLDHLRDLDDETRELVLLYEWAGRLGWSGVESSVRRQPEKYPFAAKLLAKEDAINEEAKG